VASRKKSAGLILYRIRDGRIEVLIAHMGGPLWSAKVSRGKRGWSIPKGEYTEDEEPFDAACREFREETGFDPPDSEPIELGEVVQGSGKRVTAWAIEGDLDPAGASSNMIEIEWPPKSGERLSFPEVDRVEWVDPETAGQRVIKAQAELFSRLLDRLGRD
jgi:predicted NUDIX family NTP pyrophosphohydrolase